MQTHWTGPLAALIAVYGAGLYYEQVFAPAGCCALTWPTPDPVQAERILAQIDSQGRNGAAQKQAAAAVLGARPGDPTGWLRLSYADWLAGRGRMSDAGRRALAVSYLITPYGGTFTPWRVSLALNNWGALPIETRLDVTREVEVARSGPFMDATRRAASGAWDPSGRLAAAALGIGPPRPPAP